MKFPPFKGDVKEDAKRKNRDDFGHSRSSAISHFVDRLKAKAWICNFV